MRSEGMVDTLKRLIVGRRGRARADRLVLTGADGEQKTITVKPQKNAATYLELVEACAPLRIEAYAGEELVAAWGELPPPRKAKRAPEEPARPSKRAASAPPPELLVLPKKRRSDFAIVKDLTTHLSNLLAKAYEKAADAQTAAFESLANIAQHHADRAGNAEQRFELAAKATRIRDKAINERDALILRLNAKVAEVATETNEDKKTGAFMELLKMASGKGAAATNGAASSAAKGEA